MSTPLTRSRRVPLAHRLGATPTPQARGRSDQQGRGGSRWGEGRASAMGAAARRRVMRPTPLTRLPGARPTPQTRYRSEWRWRGYQPLRRGRQRRGRRQPYPPATPRDTRRPRQQLHPLAVLREAQRSRPLLPGAPSQSSRCSLCRGSPGPSVRLHRPSVEVRGAAPLRAAGAACRPALTGGRRRRGCQQLLPPAAPRDMRRPSQPLHPLAAPRETWRPRPLLPSAPPQSSRCSLCRGSPGP